MKLSKIITVLLYCFLGSFVFLLFAGVLLQVFWFPRISYAEGPYESTHFLPRGATEIFAFDSGLGPADYYVATSDVTSFRDWAVTKNSRAEYRSQPRNIWIPTELAEQAGLVSAELQQVEHMSRVVLPECEAFSKFSESDPDSGLVAHFDPASNRVFVSWSRR